MLNSYLKNIEDEISLFEKIDLSKFDELEKIFNSSNLSNVEKFYIHHIFKNQNFKINKILKILKSEKFENFQNLKFLKENIIEILSYLQKIGIDNVKLNFKEKIKNQILLLNKQRKILLKDEPNETFFENEIVIYNNNPIYSKFTDFHFKNIIKYNSLKFLNFIRSNFYYIVPFLLILGFFITLPYFLYNDLPLPATDKNLLIYAAFWGIFIYGVFFCFTIFYFYSNFYIYRKFSESIIIKRFLWIIIVVIMSIFVTVHFLSKLPIYFQNLIINYSDCFISLSDKLIYLFYTYLFCGFLFLLFLGLIKKSFYVFAAFYYMFFFEILFLLIFLKYLSLYILLAFILLGFFNYALATDKKFDYKSSIVLSCFFIFFLSLIFSSTIAGISYIANYYEDYKIENKGFLDQNLTEVIKIIDCKKLEIPSKDDILKYKRTCVSGYDENNTLFKNLLFRTKFDDRYYFRIDFNQTLQKDFVVNKVFVK